MDSEVICNPKKKHTLTDSLNNIGLRDASASKNTRGLPFKLRLNLRHPCGIQLNYNPKKEEISALSFCQDYNHIFFAKSEAFVGGMKNVTRVCRCDLC